MKPLKTLLFLFSVFALLFVLALVFPKGGVQIADGLQLKFISSASLFQKDSSSSAYVDSLIQHARVTDDPEFEEVDSMLVELDSLFVKDSVARVKMDSIIQVHIDSISKNIFPIISSEQGKADLKSFFGKARSAAGNGELVRVIHYGDSQIENDRMTSLIRYRMQRLFGGSGCGMVPAVPLYSGNPVFKEKYGGDWKRYTVFGKRDTTLGHNSYGALSCYTSIPAPTEAGLPHVEFDFMENRRAARFSELRLFLHAYRDSGVINILVNDSISDTIYHVSGGYEELSYIPDIEADKIRLEFDFCEGGRIYGLAFDPLAGVQVDNAAMRGSSGLVFTKTDSALFHNMVNNMNTGMLILQFGGNVVPYIKSSSYYKRKFMRELRYLKKLFPDVAMLVIGPADMARKEEGNFVTYESLEPVRNVLKEAALECGCSFWDMYEAMGGSNSMKNFVLADPPLASTDYIHFTPKGANLMAGMFIDALILEYRKYEARAGR